MRSGVLFLGALVLLLVGGAVLGVLGWRNFENEGKQRHQSHVGRILRELKSDAARSVGPIPEASPIEGEKRWLVDGGDEPPIDVLEALPEPVRLDLAEAEFAAFKQDDHPRALSILARLTSSHELPDEALPMARALLALRTSRIQRAAGRFTESSNIAKAALSDINVDARWLDTKTTLVRPALCFQYWRDAENDDRAPALSALLDSVGHGHRIYPSLELAATSLLELALRDVSTHPSALVEADHTAQLGYDMHAMGDSKSAGAIAIDNAPYYVLNVNGTLIAQPVVARMKALHLRHRSIVPESSVDTERFLSTPLPAPFHDFHLQAERPPVVESHSAKRTLLLGLAIYVLGVLASAWGVWRARRAARLQADFVASVSHEMKTPIASVRAMAEFLEDEADTSPRARAYAKRMSQEMTRLGGSVRDVLDAARIERAGKYVVRTSPIDPAEVVRQTIEDLRPVVVEQGMELRASIISSPNPLALDRDALTGAIRNLIDNAMKFGRDGGVIEVNANPTERSYLIEVADRGVGLEHEASSKLFRRFARGRAAEQGALPGVGLGLYFVQEIMRAHGGTVRAQSRDGGGATFILELPRTPIGSPDEVKA